MEFWEGTDRDDLDRVFFGGGDPPADGSFDPFLPGLGKEDGSDDDVYGDTNDSGEQDDPASVIRYGRFGNQGNGRFQPDDDKPFPWERGTDQPTVGERSARERQAADTGNRNVGRVAAERGGSPPTGVRRTESAGVASSIAAAQQRIRADASVPLTDDEQRAAVVDRQEHPRSKIPRHYERQSITRPPQFQRTTFEATMMALKANAAGDWIVQIKVPAEYKSAVFDLGDAYGLALEVQITRKSYDRNGH